VDSPVTPLHPPPDLTFALDIEARQQRRAWRVGALWKKRARDRDRAGAALPRCLIVSPAMVQENLELLRMPPAAGAASNRELLNVALATLCLRWFAIQSEDAVSIQFRAACSVLKFNLVGLPRGQ
jgi:hypothetical protein